MDSRLHQLKNRKFSLPYMVGTFEIKPLMSGFVLEKGGYFYGTVLPWVSTPDNIKIGFSYFGKYMEKNIKVNDIEFN